MGPGSRPGRSELFVGIQVGMGLRPKNDPGDIGILAIRHRTTLRALLLRILPSSGFLLPLFLERLLAYTLRLGRSGSICHRLYFKGSRQSRVPQPRFTLVIAGLLSKIPRGSADSRGLPRQRR